MLETDDFLPLSGIQHFLFCRRQWALIEIEKQWQDNYLTIDGTLLHDRVDDPFFSECRCGVVLSRSVPIRSVHLGLIGVCDLVEFTQSATGIVLPGREGYFRPVVVEYKRGSPKEGNYDEAQLGAQTICLEEMLSVEIELGYLYYGETRRRQVVEIKKDLRQMVVEAAKEMHQYYRRQYSPKVKPKKGCKSCSLVDVCLPEIQAESRSVSKYIAEQIELEVL